MPLPSLPPEIWYSISTHLSPASLSSLSQVCKTLNNICKVQEHFRRHLPISQTDTNPKLLFRRLQSWSMSTPQLRYTQDWTCSLKPFCSVQDTLLLIDTANFRLVEFPSHKSVNLAQLTGIVEFNRDELTSFMSSYVIIPDSSVAFINWQSPTVLTIFNISKWEIVKHRTQTDREITKPVEYDDCIVLAGNRGEYVMYYKDNNTLILVDWRTGQLVKEVTNVTEDVIYIHGECPAINRNTIVGLVTEHTTGSLKEVRARGFDGVAMSFAIDQGQSTVAVLRSADTKTHVLVTYNTEEANGRPFEFLAYRHCEEFVQSWRGTLAMDSTLGLQNNGRIIASRHRHGLRRSRRGETTERRLVYMELKDDGTTEELFLPRLRNPGQAVWHCRTFDGGFAVLGSLNGFVQVVKLVIGGNPERGQIVNSWPFHDLKNLCVLADHIIIVERMDGDFWCLHFDRFCRGPEDISQCPMSAEQIMHADENQLSLFLNEIVNYN